MRAPIFLLAFLALSASTADAQSRYTLRLDPITAFSDVAAIPQAGLDALLGSSKDRIGGVLVVQDTKDLPGVNRPNTGLGVVVVTRTEGPAYSEVTISWPSGEPASDLEAACPVPGQDLEFLVAESGYFNGKYGRVFRVKLAFNAGSFSATIEEITKLPDGTTGIEGLACVARGNNLIAVFGERGGPENGKLRWTRLQRGTFPAQVELTDVAFDSNPSLNLSRDVSGLFRDANGLLWFSSAEDPGDFGPFRSAVQIAGTLTYDEVSPISLYQTPIPIFYSASRKIEGLTEGLIPGVPLSVVTEDEDLGGQWFPVHLAWIVSGLR
jgi:hypothetical protein